jgi:hypothetical protein
MLQLKSTDPLTQRLRLSMVLHIDSELGSYGLPLLVLTIGQAPSLPVVLVLHIHNAAGIPIIMAEAELRPETTRVVFRKLTPVGIEAYAHKPLAEQHQVAQRIWSRRVFATLHIAS